MLILKTFSNGSHFDEKMAQISAIINEESMTMKSSSISEANCDLVYENKPLWHASQRIINHLENDKIIFATDTTNKMSKSRSINLMSFSSSENQHSNNIKSLNDLAEPNQVGKVFKTNQNIMNQKFIKKKIVVVDN